MRYTLWHLELTLLLHVDSIEFIAKELGYKNQQYLRSYILEAKLENIVVPTNDNDLTGEVVDFKLDATSTSIMLDNGFCFRC